MSLRRDVSSWRWQRIASFSSAGRLQRDARSLSTGGTVDVESVMIAKAAKARSKLMCASG